MRSAADFFGRDATPLYEKRLWLLDMDGTIYEESRLFDGVLAFLRIVRERESDYMFITNNSSKSVKDYVRKVSSMGIPADEGDFFTSTQATAMYLRRHSQDGLVYVQGTESMVRELNSLGIRTVQAFDSRISAVVLGFDTELTSRKLRTTCECLTRLDVPFIATNPDAVCPVSFGFVPDCGSIAGMIQNATGRKPLFIGKPAPEMLLCAMESRGMDRERTVFVGDRLYTDIAAAKNAMVDSVLVLTGETKEGDLAASTVQPGYVFSDIQSLGSVLQGGVNV